MKHFCSLLGKRLLAIKQRRQATASLIQANRFAIICLARRNTGWCRCCALRAHKRPGHTGTPLPAHVKIKTMSYDHILADHKASEASA
jgi:hypothetical protein